MRTGASDDDVFFLLPKYFPKGGDKLTPGAGDKLTPGPPDKLTSGDKLASGDKLLPALARATTFLLR